MGSASSKFRKYVQNGDEYAAMQVCGFLSSLSCGIYSFSILSEGLPKFPRIAKIPRSKFRIWGTSSTQHSNALCSQAWNETSS